MCVYIPFVVKVRLCAVYPMVMFGMGGLCCVVDLVTGACDGVVGTADCGAVCGISMLIMMKHKFSSMDVLSIWMEIVFASPLC